MSVISADVMSQDSENLKLRKQKIDPKNIKFDVKVIQKTCRQESEEEKAARLEADAADKKKKKPEDEDEPVTVEVPVEN